jgi:predicted thioesterase
MALEKGMKGVVERTVTEDTAAHNFANPGVMVFATPMLVALSEAAAIKCLEGKLEPGQGSVGTIVNIKHLAATPLNMKVRAEATIQEVDGRRLVFNIEAFDDKEKIGEGVHERFIINMEKFLSKVAEKGK